ncbi:MAG: histidine kinase dimerization/phospho-acceptor domain-containing protein, partial [Streptosporangiaceae bacterium]
MANVSHELKTPVGAMALLAEAVLGAADDPHEAHRYGTKILHEANRLGALVTELIALSRLPGAGRLAESSRYPLAARGGFLAESVVNDGRRLAPLRWIRPL